ncbi:type III pantothenate kinase [Nitrincola alkalilacustris]|uniref:type III pantothenate kinase n=1 Tax=Nitrincola alkalilacustris TaxID=1571224 RepID=UPI00124F4B96|nr:type III pantothenate kinase [Nitrincola alkalilacustris]
MILEMDIGNTFIKWRMRQLDGIVTDAQRCPVADVEALAGELARLEDIEAVHLASVAGEGVSSRMSELARRCWGLEPVHAVSQSRNNGLINSYAEPLRMGVDRWLAMVALWQRERSAFCVVDCGSAITIDFVDSVGQHEGGYILPGLRLMRESLLGNTARVGVGSESAELDMLPGMHTTAAVHNGLNYLFHALGASLPVKGKCVYVTGGDGERFVALGGVGEYCPDLVLDGLQWVVS